MKWQQNTLGIKAIYLHTLPSAKDFIVKII